MKIGLNATCFNDRPSGAKQRFNGIYGELVKKLPDAEFVIYEPLDCPVASWFGGAPNVCARKTPISSEGRFQKMISGFSYWKTALEREDFDIFEGFNMPFVKSRSGRNLLTIHDLRGVNLEFSPLSRAVFKLVLGRSIGSADNVITVSETMKEEILKIYPQCPISVIHNGIDTHSFDDITEFDILSVRKKFSLPREFVLAVGHCEARKNYLRLIDAMAMLRDLGKSCPLLIIGNDSGERNLIESRIESLNLSKSVQILTALNDFEVKCVYKLCSIFVFPSSYEGFGIPILEAMAAGCPMVLSDLPVFREITENSGVYFPHYDVEAMALAIEKTLTSTIDRKKQIIYGLGRVQAFNFKSQANQLASLYRMLLSKN